MVLASPPAVAAPDEPPAERTLRIAVVRSAQAADCPDAQTLSERVNGTVGRAALVQADGADGDIVVTLSREGERFGARVVTGGERAGERQLGDVGATCADLADALVVTLSLLVDAGARPGPPSPVIPEAPEPEPTPPEPARSPAPPELEPEFRRPKREDTPTWVWTADVGAIQTAGLLNAATPGLFVGSDLVVAAPFGVGVGALWLPRDEARYAPGTIELSLLAWTVQGCVTFLRGESPIAVSLCVFPAVGVLSGEGVGFDSDEAASQSWIAGGASLVGDGVIVGPLGFSARLAVLVPASREFIVETEPAGGGAPVPAAAFETSAVAAVAGIAARIGIF
jgi:hypothetical protein